MMNEKKTKDCGCSSKSKGSSSDRQHQTDDRENMPMTDSDGNSITKESKPSSKK